MATGIVTEAVSNEVSNGITYAPPHLRIRRLNGHEVEGSKVAGFVFGTAMKSGRGSWRRLPDELRRPGRVVLVATPADGPDVFVGWLAAVPSENRIIYAYTKAAYRASPDQRGGRELNLDAFRIASSLALTCGIDFSRPVPCSYWSRAARAIAAKQGNPYGLRFSPQE